MMSHGRRLCQLALIIIILASLANCSLFGGPESNTGSDGYLGLILWVSRSLPRVGEPVKIRYTVENDGNRTEVIELEEKQGPVMDISIHFGAGSDWTTLYWSDRREITPEMRKLELAPGESKIIEMTWMPDETAEGYIVSVQSILNREQSRQHVSGDICVGRCPIY